MADANTVRVVGLPRLVATLRAAEVDLDELKVATSAAGQIVLAAATATAPRRTGRLASSGKASKNRRRATITFGAAAVPYAGPIHWGWPRRHIAANPWVSKAAQATEPTWTQAYVRELDAILARVEGV